MTTRFASVALVLVAPLFACTTGDDGNAECAAQADCGETTAPCDGCLAEGDALCREGVCETAGEAATSLVIDILRIEPRQLEVTSLTWAAVDAVGADGAVDCAGFLGGDEGAVNVLSSGFLNLSGGAQHTDVTVGRVPEGSVVLMLTGKDASSGDGNVIARGCEGPFDAAGTEHAFELLTLTGT